MSSSAKSKFGVISKFLVTHFWVDTVKKQKQASLQKC